MGVDLAREIEWLQLELGKEWNSRDAYDELWKHDDPSLECADL